MGNQNIATLVADYASKRTGRVEVIADDSRGWLALEEMASTFAFAELEGGELRIIPFLGDSNEAKQQTFVTSAGASWLDDADEIVLDAGAIVEPSQSALIITYLDDALAYWHSTATTTAKAAPPAIVVARSDPHLTSSDADEPVGSEAVPVEPLHIARIRAAVSPEWSWASANARIPQIAEIEIHLAEKVKNARVVVSLVDADIVFGRAVILEGTIEAGARRTGEIHVPLSARVMSQIDDRRGAVCEVSLEADGQVLARYEAAVDVQPRDLWNWKGDPLRAAQGQPNPHALSHSLLASFVRPNHPAVGAIAREAANLRASLFGESSFHAFQLSEAEAPSAVDASVTAIYEALRARKISYSEPPPGWDYYTTGQRIRDHGDVAAGGLATCMDTTVLTAAVIEEVGLNPVLVLVRDHIFIGYWRHDLTASGSSGHPSWHPRLPVVTDAPKIATLVEAGYLGLIETTALTVDIDMNAEKARLEAKHVRFAHALAENDVTLIDLAIARRLGVSPLPAVTERPDGVTEVFEYRVNAPATVSVVDTQAPEAAVRERRIDAHPPRYRTWKSSLFSLNATNPLLNLGMNARVQPLVVPSTNLAELEDMLHQDKSFMVHSAFDLPEVWTARGTRNAMQILDAGDPDAELTSMLRSRVLYVQRLRRVADGLRAVSPDVTIRELRTMAHNAKTAREERGMNPLYLCLGVFRWSPGPGKLADAPIILVPVNLVGSRGGRDFTLSLDTTQQATTNAALIEWLRREHGLSIPGLAEPIADHAGIDVNAVLSEARNALLGHNGDLSAQVLAEARLATLDLSTFRMWQDLNANADIYLERPLIRHLVETPAEEFVDAAIAAAPEITPEDIEKVETPVPADSTQKRAVLWASQGRTFVLQGPPGTGKSQTITNMVAECVLAGLRVLFVAEKGTALSVVQRRLDSIGLAPFALNLHHEGSNSVEVRASLQRALTASVTPDALAMESARRRLRNARFELTQYPTALHSRNAAGHSAYSAQDELLVLGDGPSVDVPTDSVDRLASALSEVKEVFADLQRWTSAAGVRPNHPWRFAGPGAGEPFNVERTRLAVEGILAATSWTDVPAPLAAALEEASHPQQLTVLAAATDAGLPIGDELAWILDSAWLDRAPSTIHSCAQSADGWRHQLHGLAPDTIHMNLEGISRDLEAANASGFLGRKNRQAAAIAPLVEAAPAGLEVTPASAPKILSDLLAARNVAGQIRAAIVNMPGLAQTAPANPFSPGAFDAAYRRIEQLRQKTEVLRNTDSWTMKVRQLAGGGHLHGYRDQLVQLARDWVALVQELDVQDDDLRAWVGDSSLLRTASQHAEEWARDARFNRLLGLQQWCALVRRVESMRVAGLTDARASLLEGRLHPEDAEDALARGIARASLSERVRSAGLDRFDAVAHNHRAQSYAAAQSEVREQWSTAVPAQLLEQRGGAGRGTKTGGLARELEKTTRRLGTRAILRKYGNVVQELTPLVLASPASVVDLIDPRLMEFDVVIFDEASQITVPEAIGSLGRARAAIIVGDSKQMPPTRRVGGSATDEEVEDADIEEVFEDQESILSESELARVPALSLSWHYRSQDEQLIAFSNHKYYKGDLSSFPTPTLMSTETGIEFRRVAMPGEDAHEKARGYRKKPEGFHDGRYLRAGSKAISLGGNISASANTNPAEAFAIVDAVRELVRLDPEGRPSIGIVTFNERQRELIEDLLIASDDPGIRTIMNELKMGRNDVLFVKALEQVQGDERDTIIFSVAFSKQANGKIPTNFGPLSNSGGERRLNVAVTRARRKDIVFCSFDPSDLDVSGSAYDGPKHFKDFLLEAARATGASTEIAGRTAIRDRHRDDIASALREAGLHVLTDVGMSNFRLDLVLARPDAPDRLLLPILLDGESWTRRITVSDRDVLPLEVLTGLMGWPAVARIWWPMWLQNRDLVVAQILSQVDEAEQAFGLAEAGQNDAGTEEVVNATVVDEVAVAPATALRAAPTSLESPVEAFRVAAPTPGSLAAAATDATDSVGVVEPRQPIASAPPAGDTQPRVTDVVRVFEPANTEVVGPREVLDSLSRRASVAKVREQIVDVIEFEGPIELGRLIRIVAKRFGLNAVRAARAEHITKIVPRGHVKKSDLGTFAWPESIDPATWTAYRTADADGSRSLEEIAPEEIRNAMLAVRSANPGFDDDALIRGTAEIFGISRLGAHVRTRLLAVHSRLPHDADN
ncbi:DUF3320 domain-containing protein [Microbacterium mitrae]|uniref:DUF4011 domain-containing protein n=1 Tax=Microbacterium mitrae TaxID=664640 RepID=A0A5C8HKJ3_9MICO|nr:DUF4011 domain-containing protein [Microbacterium mitrae]TXK03386.1 DUF4011 domain-containing protein [Microbacterium mitrae]